MVKFFEDVYALIIIIKQNASTNTSH